MAIYSFYRGQNFKWYQWRELPQYHFCRDKHTQTRVCRDKTFVATKMTLVAAPANDKVIVGYVVKVVQRLISVYLQSFK